jgi:hypothetical protein
LESLQLRLDLSRLSPGADISGNRGNGRDLDADRYGFEQHRSCAMKIDHVYCQKSTSLKLEKRRQNTPNRGFEQKSGHKSGKIAVLPKFSSPIV